MDAVVVTIVRLNGSDWIWLDWIVGDVANAVEFSFVDRNVEYIEKWSFWLDVKICLKTALMTILNRSGGH